MKRAERHVLLVRLIGTDQQPQNCRSNDDCGKPRTFRSGGDRVIVCTADRQPTDCSTFGQGVGVARCLIAGHHSIVEDCGLPLIAPATAFAAWPTQNRRSPSALSAGWPSVSIRAPGLRLSALLPSVRVQFRPKDEEVSEQPTARVIYRLDADCAFELLDSNLG